MTASWPETSNESRFVRQIEQLDEKMGLGLYIVRRHSVDPAKVGQRFPNGELAEQSVFLNHRKEVRSSFANLHSNLKINDEE